jgi:hypothetical protein
MSGSYLVYLVGPAYIQSGSPTVFADNLPVAREADPVDQPKPSAVASTVDPVTAHLQAIAALAAKGLNPDGTFQDTTENDYASSEGESDGDEFDTPANTATSQTHVDTGLKTGVYGGTTGDGQTVPAGTLTSNSVPSAPVTTSGNTDTTPPPSISGSTVDCSVFASYTNTEYPPGDPIYSSLMLTPSTSLSTFTTKAALWGGGGGSGGRDGKWLKCQTIVDSKGGSYNLTMPQILCNLAHLALNCYEKIKAQYPNVIVTNTYRQGTNNRQHGTGQAVDLQFSGAAPSDYLGIATWIKNNISFNQLLLEVSNGRPWIHVSYFMGTGINVASASKVGTMFVDQGAQAKFIVGLQQVA